MSITDNKITRWNNPIVNEADRPQRSASDMKAVFDSNSNQIRTSLNALIDDLSSGEGDTYLASDGLFKVPQGGSATNGVKEGGNSGDIYVKSSTAVFDASWKSPESIGLLKRVNLNTQTNINGIFEGDGSNIKALTTIPVNKGGTGATTAQQARANLGALNGAWPVALGGTGATSANDARANLGVACNTNLIDNWDFRNPVNQRGLAVYEGIGYTIDRWKHPNSAYQKSEVLTTGIKVGISLNTPVLFPADIMQTILTSGIDGRAATLSVYVEQLNSANCKALVTFYNAAGNVISSTSTPNITQTGLTAHTFNIPSGCVKLTLALRGADSRNGDIVSSYSVFSRVKLELSSVSTLAYDLPVDYVAELLKCQRYFVRYSANPNATNQMFPGIVTIGDDNKGTYLIPIPVHMRVTPTLTMKDVAVYQYVPNYRNGIGSTKFVQSVFPITAIAVSNMTSGGVYCQLTVGNDTDGNAPYVNAMGIIRSNGSADGCIELSADL